MEPTLTDGQGLIAVRWPHAAVGQIRCIEHPDRPGFWLVKRVDELHGDDAMWVLSDNRSATLADSRSFGPVPIDGTYLVIVRVPRRLM